MKTFRAIFFLPILLFGLLGTGSTLEAKDKFEFSFHYGHWSLNLLKPAIETLAEDFAEQMKNKQVDKIKEDHPGFEEVSFKNTVEFDSGGPNYGFEARWYPAGEDGSFSLGLSMEKTTLRITLPKVSTSLALENQATHEQASFQAIANADVESNPLAFLISFRWDIFPIKRIHPYFTLGFGMASIAALDETKMTYNFNGTLTIPGEAPDVIEESGSKTLAQLKEEDRQRKADEGSNEEPFDYPIKFLPFLQLHVGLKGKITNFLHAMVDFGVFDGFLFRGGIAVRF